MNAPRRLKVGVRDDVEFGEGVTLVEPVNLYGCRIGDGSFVGPFVEIQSDAIIGKECRIQSHAFICSWVTIGDGCFVGHGVMFINDRFDGGQRAMGDTSKYQKTHIGDHVTIGSNATIMPVTICDHACIGAGSVVTKDIDKPGIYAGNPARWLKPLAQEVQGEG